MSGTVALWWGDPNLAAQYRADLLQAVDRERAENARAPRAERDWRVSRALLQQVRSAGPAHEGQMALAPTLLASDELERYPAAPAAPALSLSHARGHALVGTAPAGWLIGVDLEAIVPRDAGRLAQWCCTDDEQAALARCAGDAQRLRMFYLLWTLKESLIKAANLDFPADMRSVGLAPPRAEREAVLATDSNAGQGTESFPRESSIKESSATEQMDCHPWAHWRLRAPRVGWQAWAAVVDNAWIAAVVWRPADEAETGSLETPRCPARGAFTGSRAMPAWHTAQGAASPRIVPTGQWFC